MQKTEQASQQTSIELPKFNKSIKIDVDVDTVYEKLRGEFPEDYKHRDILSHAIIGTAVEENTLLFIFNALNGYPATLDFAIGETIECLEETKAVWNEGVNGEWVSQTAEVGICTVVEINPYTKWNKVKVKYEQRKHKSYELEVVEKWVSHKKCTKWAGNIA